jgi:hypothetical protein
MRFVIKLQKVCIRWHVLEAPHSGRQPKTCNLLKKTYLSSLVTCGGHVTHKFVG